MTRDQAKNKRLVSLFLLGLLAFNYPILSIFNLDTLVFGIPLLYVFLFFAWFLLIVLTGLSTTSKPVIADEDLPEGD